MAGGAPLRLPGNRAAALAALLVAAGCARNAPVLPPDLGHLPPAQRLLPGDAASPEARMDCAELAREAAYNRDAAQQHEAAIASSRPYNQAAAWLGIRFYRPLLLTLRNDDQAKQSLDRLQARADRIDRLSKAKGC